MEFCNCTKYKQNPYIQDVYEIQSRVDSISSCDSRSSGFAEKGLCIRVASVETDIRKRLYTGTILNLFQRHVGLGAADKSRASITRISHQPRFARPRIDIPRVSRPRETIADSATLSRFEQVESAPIFCESIRPPRITLSLKIYALSPT